MEMELCIDVDRIENKVPALYNVTTDYAWFSLERRESRANNREAYKDANQGALTNAGPSKIYVPRGSFRGHLGQTRLTSEGSEELVIN